MKNNKWINLLISTWGIATILIIIGYLVQVLLPTLNSKYRYMEMINDSKYNFIIMVILMIITVVIIGAIAISNDKDKDVIKKYFEKKRIIIPATLISICICLLFVFAQWETTVSGAVKAKSVETLNGKVEKIQSKTKMVDGVPVKNMHIITKITIVDSNGKHHNLLTSNLVKNDATYQSRNVQKNAKIRVEYIPSKYTFKQDESDGRIVNFSLVVE